MSKTKVGRVKIGELGMQKEWTKTRKTIVPFTIIKPMVKWTSQYTVTNANLQLTAHGIYLKTRCPSIQLPTPRRKRYITRGPGARAKLGTPRPAKNALASFIMGGWSRPTSITQPEHLHPITKRNGELMPSQSSVFDINCSLTVPKWPSGQKQPLHIYELK